MTYEPKPGEYEASLWPEDGQRGKYWKQGRPMEILEPGKYWVNLYPNNSENSAAPEFRLKLKKVEDSGYRPEPVREPDAPPVRDKQEEPLPF